LILAAACLACVVSVALIVITALLPMSGVLLGLAVGAAVALPILAIRNLRGALATLSRVRLARSSPELAELRRQLAELPEIPHPLGL
jgi:hypothetical protein